MILQHIESKSHMFFRYKKSNRTFTITHPPTDEYKHQVEKNVLLALEIMLTEEMLQYD